MTNLRRAFTLVELMVAITIVIILAGILMVAVSKSMAAGRRVRAQADLQSIGMALEAYKQDFGDYPRPDGVANSAQILCRALVGSDPYADGQAGPGFRIRPGGQGKVYGPYIDLDKFDLTVYPADDGANPVIRSKVYAKNDQNPVPPILYIPKSVRPIQPNEHYVGVDVLPVPPGVQYMYNAAYVPSTNFSGTVTWWPLMPLSGGASPLAQMQAMMGNKLASGTIGAGETPAFTGPYILWMAGPDGFFGLTNSRGARDVVAGGYMTDDIANFNFDPAITVK